MVTACRRTRGARFGVHSPWRRPRLLGALVGLALMTIPPPEASAWGLQSHRWVARRAAALVATRCPSLVVGFEAELADRAVEPDTVLKGRHGRAETVRHFLDLDDYGEPPFRALPQDYERAVARYGRETVEERGVLPWHVARLAKRLRTELRRGVLSQARVTAGYLAHYVADATMPLHATRNYDGQLTRQRGLHARIERKLVDGNFERYAVPAERARYRTPIAPEDAAARMFEALRRSYDLVAPLLAADRAARRDTRVGSALYFRRLEVDLGDDLARRLGRAAALTAAVWDGACEAPSP